MSRKKNIIKEKQWQRNRGFQFCKNIRLMKIKDACDIGKEYKAGQALEKGSREIKQRR